MYFQPLEGPLGPNPFSSLTGIAGGEGPLAQAYAPGTVSGDAISRLVPPWLTAGASQNPMQTALFGPLAGLLQQLMQMLQWMTQTGLGTQGYGGPGTGGPGAPGSCLTSGNERFFANATGGSNGDPHLSFNGNTWNSMASQPDLIESDSIPGGFRVSTQVTPPNAKGTTWNQSATVTMNGGATTVTMNSAGQPAIENYGQNVPIAPGQTVQLGNGASVTCDRNGSLSVTAQNGTGGTITTTLAATGEGVNVGVNAQNVDLGGALANGRPTPPAPPPVTRPIPSPIGGPIPGPIRDPFPPPIRMFPE